MDEISNILFPNRSWQDLLKSRVPINGASALQHLHWMEGFIIELGIM
jgi:hypothetical protein